MARTLRDIPDQAAVMLDTNDSLILAVMQRERIHYLATNDPDFERVPGIAVRQPE
jgi:predicted nucleic acid-binding protein